MQTDEYGEIWGFRALIPYKHIKQYKRKNLSHGVSTNLVGAFELLLETYPSIEETIRNYYLKNRKKTSKINQKVLHKKFLNACREIGLTLNDYPFNTETNAKKALQRYTKKLEKLHFLNHEAQSKHDFFTKENQNSPLLIRPYQRVQFDGHRIDTAIAVVFKTPEGDEVIEVMNRIWLLVIIDVATRAILGHHLCLNKEYSSSDVLRCIRNAVVPWKRKSLTIPGLKYSSNGSFPSDSLKEAQWGLWDEFLYDNARANLSNIVRDRLTQIVGCAVNAGPVRVPERRAIIERFFKTLEDNSYHQLPSTTGSHPRDPLRKDAEQKAIKYRILSSHLEEITDVLIANYNATPHEGIINLTPLEALQQRVSRGMLIRTIPEEQRNEVAFFSMKVERVIKGNRQHRKRPHINFEGVVYHNEILSRSYDLIGTKLTLLVNTEDLRSIHAYLPDGSEFGTLTASGKWGISPHDLKTRRLLNKLRNRKIIHVLNEDDPVEILQRYLESESRKKKNVRNTLSTLNRYLEEYSSKELNDQKNLEKSKKQNELEGLETRQKHEQLTDKPSSRRLTKTISY
ncbi:DDE-type integrase/transposase/recombinase [Fictibacillus gelatini]|uniref:DDE-type integrase/transposase/recombinase n=1 Tax=Fictibacillus gelatini TaxID=225985 RepID=UPI000421E146|nr:DDE-type integrase/transposase/recombinase [Fictibacillus gelatini]